MYIEDCENTEHYYIYQYITYPILVLAIVGCFPSLGQRVLVDSSANLSSQTAPSLDMNIPTIHEVHTTVLCPLLPISSHSDHFPFLYKFLLLIFFLSFFAIYLSAFSLLPPFVLLLRWLIYFSSCLPIVSVLSYCFSYVLIPFVFFSYVFSHSLKYSNSHREKRIKDFSAQFKARHHYIKKQNYREQLKYVYM